ncbi:MAG: tetratricopeptide repeat protein [Actinomycetota bacterium]
MTETLASARSTPLPTGKVTFLFTDIEGSTKLLHRLGDDYAEVLATHRRLLRAAFTSHDGCEVDTQGDGFFVAFGRVFDAIAAALDSQRALYAQDWPHADVVLVRMGIHAGQPLVVDDNYVGMDVHRAARICSAAHGGQVILSESTYAKLSPNQKHEISVKDLGAHRLKDLAHPERILQLTPGDLPVAFPPLRSLRPPTNVPQHLEPLVGRHDDLRDLRAKLLDDSVRLVTVTGPGGIGKTKLCAAVALDLLEDFINGAFFVDLTTATTIDLVASRIAQDLQIPVEGDRDAADVLVDHLGDKHMLLVLDNLEQAIDGASVVRRLLQSSPNLTVLATSRVLLSIQGEAEYALAPLGLPRGATRDEVELSDAAQLFVERAAKARPGFVLTEENASTIAAICNLLDGLPLALELAAARVKLMTPEGLLGRLDNRLKLLTGGSRDSPARHRELRATIDWSYDLLSPNERTLLRDLSVFSGGATLEATEHVVGNEVNVLDGLTALVDHSLVRLRDDEGVRFSMLQTIRDYALELLEDHEGKSAVRDRHAHYYLELAEAFAEDDETTTHTRIDIEHDNMRVALTWWLERADEQPEPNTGLALRLAVALGRFWYRHGHAVEGSEWLERTLANHVEGLEDVLANGLRLLGVLMDQRGDLERATQLFEEALNSFRSRNDRVREGACLNSLGVVARSRRDLERAKSLLTESVAIRRELQDSSGMSSSLSNLAILYMDLGDTERAKELLEETMRLDNERGDAWGVAVTSLNLGVARLELEEVDPAADMVKRSVQSFVELGDLDGVAEGIEALAGVAAAERGFVRAARLAGAADTLRRALGIPLTDVDRDRFDRWLSEPRKQLAHEGFKAAWAEGAGMTTEQAIDYALQDHPGSTPEAPRGRSTA